MLPLVLTASLFIGSHAVPLVRAAGFTGTGLVCITTSSTATNCSNSAPNISPLTVGSTLRVGVFINNSKPMGGFEIYVKNDPAFLQPTGVNLATLIVNPSLTSICINGSAQTGSCTVGTANGPGVVEATTIESSGSNECGGIVPCSGMAFIINYTVVGATPTTSLSYPTAAGCSTSSVSSPANVCVLIADNTGTTLPENIQGATVTAPAAMDPTTSAVSCSSPVAVGIASSCTATVTDTASTGAINPTGQVTFSSDGPGGFSPANSCSVSSLGSNQATCTVSYTPTDVGAGTHNIGASYSGDSTHAASTATAFGLTVTKSTPSLATVLS